MKIKGKKITLIPIKPDEKDEFYKLATESYGSKFWHDEKEKTKLTKEKFFQDWHEGYFDLNSLERGQCFWIIVNGKKIGQVNYNEIDSKNKKVELDIIIGTQENMGRGYSSDALKALMKYLFEKLNINKIWIEPRANNIRAIKAYKKIGFRKEALIRKEEYFEGKLVSRIRLRVLKKDFLR